MLSIAKKKMAMNSIELETIALVFVSEFVSQNKSILEKDNDGRIKFLRMSAKNRMKYIEKTLDSIVKG